ncbi:MAG TPA: sulfatase-like hydrolase/transferase [Saprospiraceae bacterium]|nr:sulfatase-like hydrolase/transferase [Saprospiraceae bacterium]
MKSVFVFPLRLLAFWLLFFAMFRVWFVSWFTREWLSAAPMSAWKSLWYALPLDLSTAGYLMVVPMLFWLAGLAIGDRSHSFFGKAISTLNVILISVLVLVFGSNIFIYEEWHTLLNNRALEYLSTPRALLDSMSLLFQIICVGLYFIVVWLMWRSYRFVVGARIFPKNASRWGALAFPVHAGLLFLAIRGGLGVIPINESAVYYSPHLFNNHAATNAAWNLIHSLIETRSTVNHYRFMDEKEAEERTGCRLGKCLSWDGGPFDILNNQDSSHRINIVFLIMESHTAQVVEELGGEPGVCPNLSRLIREGILFENIYGSGYRTDQGLVSILAGYPAQPDQSIVLQTDKAAKLNSIPKILHGQGYSTAFFYGGELTFANIGVWLTNQRFEQIFSEKDFSRAEKKQRWGVDDHILLQRAVNEINRLKEPFFATAMTLSLHPPYDVPYQSRWQGNDEREKFLNSAAFADYAIGEFFKTAGQQPWYENTLFILVADHGSRNPGGVGLDNPKSRHIPLIFFGKPLNKKWHGAKVPVFGNHHDIPATVLGMWDLYNRDLYWSRNLWVFNSVVSDYSNPLNQRFESAYYTNETGLGWANSKGKGFYAFGSGDWYIWEGQLDSISRTDAKAYLQTLYEDFLSK